MFRMNELRKEEKQDNYFSRLPEISFDPDNIILEGWYPDELSAYRAKKTWEETLAHYFLLEPEDDFELSVQSIRSGDAHRLSCSFYSACARYAFWRITNEQAPEAQYIIETAHIPKRKVESEDHYITPDLTPLTEDPLRLAEYGQDPIYNESWLKSIKRIFQKLSDS